MYICIIEIINPQKNPDSSSFIIIIIIIIVIIIIIPSQQHAIIIFKNTIIIIMLPSGNQTWLAGKCQISRWISQREKIV